MAKKKHSMKRDPEGLTARQRAFVREWRADPSAANATIAKRAGFLGDNQKLGERARVLMRMPKIALALHAPVTLGDVKTDQKTELRRRLLAIVRNERTPDARKIRAIDQLLATIPGGYVPQEAGVKSRLTMAQLVQGMGFKPPGQGEDA